MIDVLIYLLTDGQIIYLLTDGQIDAETLDRQRSSKCERKMQSIQT